MSLAAHNVAAQAVIDETFEQVNAREISPLGVNLPASVGDEIRVVAQTSLASYEDPEGAFDLNEIQWTSGPDSAVEFLDEQKEFITDEQERAAIQYSVLVRFLEPGPVLIEGAAFTAERPVPSNDFITAQFEFQVVSADDSSTGTTETLTANQRTAQATLDDVCDASQDSDTDVVSAELQATCDALDLLDDPADALDAVVPDELFSIGDMLVTTADQQQNTVTARINTIRSGQRKAFDISGVNLTLGDEQLPGAVLSEIARAASFPGGGASADDAASSFANSNIGVFINGNFSFGEFDGDNIQSDTDFSTSIFTLGADYRLGSDRVIGAALSVESDNTDFAADDGELDMQGFGLTAFGTWYEEDRGYADFIFTISQNEFDISRRINLAGNGDEFAEGSSDATRFALAVNVGRTLQRGATEFGPLASFSIMRASVDGFTETSTLAANGVSGNGVSGNGAGTTLDVESQSVTSVQIAVGGELKHVINTSKAVLVPYAKLLLDFETQTEKDEIIASFVDDSTATEMRFIGAERDASSLLFSLGTTAVFIGDHSAFVSVETRLLDDRIRQTQLQLGYRTQF